MIMIVNPETTVVARNPTTVDLREDGLRAVIATAKTTEKTVVSPAAGIHQARAASIKGLAASQAAVVIQAAVIKVDKAIMRAGNVIAVTAEVKAKTTT